jgi:hypothetical protein
MGFNEENCRWFFKANLTPFEKGQKMARQNTFEILLLNDANMIKEHQETKNENAKYVSIWEKALFDLERPKS